jgi:hypothetical protein
MSPASRFAILLVVLAMAPWLARADAPNACSFLTPALVSSALGKPVTGGNVSVVDHAGASASSCLYRAGMTMVIVSVDERGSAAAAMTEYNTQLDNSRGRDKEGQKTVLEPGLGEAAFSGVDGPALDITAVHGSRVFQLGVVGAQSFPHEQLRSLMQTAISH